MTRSTLRYGLYQAAETDVVFGNRAAFAGAEPRGVVFCHGSGENASTTVQQTETRLLCSRLSDKAVVHAGDLGFQTWGNDTAIARIGAAVAHLRASWGVVGPVALVAGSMGFSGACAYARANPSEVRGIAGVIPLTDIVDIMSRGATAEVNAAYGGAYNDTTHGPTHNPIRFAASLAMPIHLWTAPADPLTVPATATAFVAARPQTQRTILSPGQAHTLASVAEATPALVDWVHDLF